MRTAALLLVTLLPGFAPAAEETLAEARRPIDESFHTALAELAERCDKKALVAEAAITRSWRMPRDRRTALARVTNVVSSRVRDRDAEWLAGFMQLRKDYAAALFGLAPRFANSEPAAVYELLHEVLREDPNHAAARKIFGQTSTGVNKASHAETHWSPAGPFDPRSIISRPQPATTDHPTLGWKRGGYVRLESPHFRLTANVPAADALVALEQLELLHNVWQRVFFRVASRPGALAARIGGATEPLFKDKKYQVVLFRDRDSYIAALSAKQPKIAMTTGLYIDKDAAAYLYAAPRPAGKKEFDSTLIASWYHEVTHQLLQENLGDRVTPGETGNFWIIEGIAMYFESLAEHADFYTLGGWDSDRLQFARYRTFARDTTVDLNRLLTLSKDDIQQHADIRRLYTQAAGYTHLLMDDEHGKRREQVIDYLNAVYKRQDQGDTFRKVVRIAPDEVDGRLPEFLQVRDEDTLFIAHPADVTNLSFGGTTITDVGLARLKTCRRLEWLDLSRTNVTDDGLKVIAEMPQLKQLFLEGTKATGKTLELVSRLAKLEELDLSSLAITNDDLRNLSAMPELRVLHLTGTRIDDTGLSHLSRLRKLERLETAGSNVTPEGRDKWLRALPKRKP